MLPTAIVARNSGLSERLVRWFSRQTTWNRIRLVDANKFAGACGVDLRRLNWTKRVFLTELATKSPFSYLGTKESKIFVRILESLPPDHPMITSMKCNGNTIIDAERKRG